MATPQQPFEPGARPDLRPDPEAALNLPVGVVSPLWFAFFGAAATASTWWWMTRWARDMALDGAAGAVSAGTIPGVPVESASFAPLEEPGEIAAETVAEATGLVIDPVIEAPVAVAPELKTVTPKTLTPKTLTPKTGAAIADDLTRLVGIGPKLAAALAERGVTTFAQIAAWQGKELNEIDQALSLKGRAVRDAWVSQARRLATG